VRARSALSVLAVAVTAATTVVLLPAGPAAAEEVYAVPKDGVFHVDGHGWGHGRGLNQWGAQGAAQAGVSHQQILAQYYPGTTMQTIPSRPMRVRIDDDEGSDVQVRGVSGLAFVDVATNARYVLGATYPRWRARLDSSGFRVEGLSGSTWVAFRGVDNRTAWSGPIRFQDASPIRVHFNNGTAREYRGTITAVRNNTTPLVTVNTLTLEEYLYGVVPRESPASFHPEALRAQAVAARSYSAYKRDHAAAGSPWDICSTIQCQVYGGRTLITASGTVVAQEQPATNAAVDATAGQVRWYDGGPIFAEFSSSNGGWSTAHATFPYLSARRDDWDRLASPHHAWTGQVSAAQIQRRYPSVGTLLRLRVITRDGNGEWGGRVKRVVLEGRDASGRATSVEASGAGIFYANQWPGSSNGLRGSWWKIRGSGLLSTVVSKPGTVTLVRPPGQTVKDHAVTMRNSGTVAWRVDGLHLAVSSPPGGADPLANGSTRPGLFLGNATRPGATTVEPGESASFRVRLDLTTKPAGSYRPTYRVRLGTGQIFGAEVRWDVHLVEAALTAAFLGISDPDNTPVAAGARPPVSVLTVLVPTDGGQRVRFRYRNTGNVVWPVGGLVRLGTSGPRDRVSPSQSAGWLSSNRMATLTASETAPGADRVAPGEVGYFDVLVAGNGREPGLSGEGVEPVWEGRAWMGGAAPVEVVRLDPAAERRAVSAPPAPAPMTLLDNPDGTATVRVRLRNVGGAAWPVGTGERLTTAPADRASGFDTAEWTAPHTGGQLVANVSRRGQPAVHPGEVGEWELPVSARGVRPGDYTEGVQAVRVADTTRYGPVVDVPITVAATTFSGSVTSAPGRFAIPRIGRKAVAIMVRNTGNAAWTVGGLVRVGSKSGSGAADGWLSPIRPTAVSSNASRPGAPTVEPGEVARFAFVMGGNGRAAGTYTEVFGVLWEAYAWCRCPDVRVTYTLT
jgi:SpoIID/LytB domain protein